MRVADLNVALGCDDSVDWGLGERVEGLVLHPHELRLEQVAAVAVVLELALVQLHREVGSLEVEGHQLATSVPEDLNKEIDVKKIVRNNLNSVNIKKLKIYLWHEVAGVYPSSLGVETTDLPLVIVDKLNGL